MRSLVGYNSKLVIVIRSLLPVLGITSFCITGKNKLRLFSSKYFVWCARVTNWCMFHNAITKKEYKKSTKKRVDMVLPVVICKSRFVSHLPYIPNDFDFVSQVRRINRYNKLTQM